MKGLHGLGLVLGSAAVWTLTLWLSRTFPLPVPFGVFTTIAAVGLPAFFAAALAYRWRLPVPAAWAGAGFCLGSGIVTGISFIQYMQQTGGSYTAARLAQVVLAHAGTATVLMPAEGGFVPSWGNLLTLAIAVVIGVYGVDTYRTGRTRAKDG